MHPLFVELFIHPDEAELQAEEERQRSRRVRRSRSKLVVTVRSQHHSARPRGSAG